MPWAASGTGRHVPARDAAGRAQHVVDRAEEELLTHMRRARSWVNLDVDKGSPRLSENLDEAVIAGGNRR